MRVAIIGAGINGLYLAFKLSQKGHQVTVFEKKSKIGNPACSGLFSERILDFFPQSQKLIRNKISYVLIHFSRKTLRIDFSRDFLMMNHSELDELAADLAEKSGVKIILNHDIKEIPQGFDKIIGADGPLSPVRKNLGLKDPKYRLGILGFVRDPISDNFVETWPVKSGFIWKIPRGDCEEYGILANPKKAKKLFDDFLKKNNIVLDNLRAKLVPQGLILPKNSFVTLAGDAAGLTKPWSGGGVIWQLSLADILLENFPDFLKYRKKARRKFRAKLFFSKIIVKLVYFLGFNFPLILPSKIKMDSDYLFWYNNKKP